MAASNFKMATLKKCIVISSKQLAMYHFLGENSCYPFHYTVHLRDIKRFLKVIRSYKTVIFNYHLHTCITKGVARQFFNISSHDTAICHGILATINISVYLSRAIRLMVI